MNKKLKGIAAYSYERGNWEVWNVSTIGDCFVSASGVLKRISDYGKYLYPKIVDVDINWINLTGGKYTYAIDFDVLPEVTTLEQSIKQTKKKLESYPFRWL